ANPRAAKPQKKIPANDPEGPYCLKEIPTIPEKRGRPRGDPTYKAGSIKALAFNTLLSSQETDTHRAGPAFAFPAPGRLLLLYQIRSECQFPGFSDCLSGPLARPFRAVTPFHQIRLDSQNRALSDATTSRLARQSRVGC
ncbi:hypothetical protein, partial [Actinomadura opuntiae]|uniref:hypothetical protein n=1 Tax=Actinomadura sp. OS1-43 TaxID=604315 RepID=UPI00255AAF62